MCAEFKCSVTTSHLHIIAESTKYIETHILKVTAEILVSFGAELKGISNQVGKYFGHYYFCI